jgi:cytochrome c553
MQGMIKALKDDEKVGVVMFFSSQAVQARPAAQPALATQGKKYYDQICVRCHGADGAGNEKIARIAGQQPEYLKLTLQRYRSGSGERIDPLMAANTKLMTDADIQAVVAYVSSMP